jgi:uncharacterized protein
VEPSLPHPNRDSRLERLQALIEVLLLSGLFSGLLAALPFSVGRWVDPASMMTHARDVTAFLLLEASVAFILLSLVLRAHHETLRDLGLRRNRWRFEAIVGLGVVPLLFLLSALITESFRIYLPGYYLDRNPLTEMIRTPLDLGLFLCSAVIAGGIKEELQRAFILVRFRDHLGGAWLGLVLWSVVFGIGHYLQGPQGIIAGGGFGLIFGVLYLVRGSLVAPVVAHSMYDVLALLGYWFSRS